MTKDQKKLFCSRSSSQEFLFYQTDAKPVDDQKETAVSVDPGKLSQEFPEMLTGQAFVDNALSRLEGASQFGAMAVKIDDLSTKDSDPKSPPTTDTQLEVARTIDAICKSQNGIWGLLDSNTFGSFFPDGDETSATATAESIKSNPTLKRKATVSIGIAVYPNADFDKGQILDNAGKALEHAAFFGPDSLVLFDAVSLNISGDTFYQKGDIDSAVKEFKAALVLDPSNVNVHNSLGVCYGVMGNFDEAKAEFLETMRLDPQETMAIYNLGLVHLLTDQKEKALKHFLDANRDGENIFEVAFQTGKLYLEMEQPEKAKVVLEKAVDLKPESGLTFRYLGECCAAMNLTADAVAAYKNAIRLNPNDAESLSALGYLFDLQGENPDITTIFCQQSVEIAPDNGLFRHRLGSLYLKRNQLEEALEQFQKANELGHDSKKLIKKIQKLMREA
jgi:Flp pilus assembly protein TadD/GGDEF domain-containing protein